MPRHVLLDFYKRKDFAYEIIHLFKEKPIGPHPYAVLNVQYYFDDSIRRFPHAVFQADRGAGSHPLYGENFRAGIFVLQHKYERYHYAYHFFHYL